MVSMPVSLFLASTIYRVHQQPATVLAQFGEIGRRRERGNDAVGKMIVAVLRQIPPNA